MRNKQPAPDLEQPLERRFEQLSEPFNRFVSNQISGAVLLLACTLAALAFTNTALHSLYIELEKIELGIFIQNFELRKTLHHWVNDGLMVLFFFLLGLEIKREFMVGELRSFSQSITVIMAAAGGMLFPALVYLAFNLSGGAVQGWGIPMATDAAFALGALVLLGKHIPAGLKVFLVALAIVDDIGAIIVIALFYTDNLQLNMLWLAAGMFGSLLLINRLGIRHPLPYLGISIGLWYAVLLSGVHATISGVVAALAIPAQPRLHPRTLARSLRKTAASMDGMDPHRPQEQLLADEEKHEELEDAEAYVKAARTPLRSWENMMERPVSLLVLPIFAFLNAGIALSSDTFRSMLSSPISGGVIAGLVVGKPLGIVAMTWLTIKMGWGELPEKIGLSHLLGLGMLAGMGFTMSIFIGTLSFEGQAALLTEVKASIMLATAASGLAGIVWLSFLSHRDKNGENHQA